MAAERGPGWTTDGPGVGGAREGGARGGRGQGAGSVPLCPATRRQGPSQTGAHLAPENRRQNKTPQTELSGGLAHALRLAKRGAREMCAFKDYLFH